MRGSRVALLLAVAGVALGLAACGGGGNGSTSTSASTPAGTPNRGEGTEAAPQASAKGQKSQGAKAKGSGQAEPNSASVAPPLTRASARRAERRAEARQAARHRALVKKAGHAAPFLVPTGDNSIPTYGAEAPSSEQAAATASLQAYLQARAAGDWSAACAQMAATVQKQLALLAGSADAKAESCAAAYGKLSSRVPDSARANPLSGQLTAFRVKDTKAFALFYGPQRQQYMMPMVSEEGGWRVNQLEPVPWPIGASPPSG